MEALERDASELWVVLCTFTNADFGSILKAFKKYEYQQSTIRRYLVLRDHFAFTNSERKNDREADTIHELFPDVERDRIVNLLDAMEDEQNSIRIVIKLLLNEKLNALPKYVHWDNDGSIPLKKLNHSVSNRQENEPPVSSADSASTIVYVPEDFRNAEVYDNVASSIIDDFCGATVDSTNYNLDIPSTSRFHSEIIKSVNELDQPSHSRNSAIKSANEISSVTDFCQPSTSYSNTEKSGDLDDFFQTLTSVKSVIVNQLSMPDIGPLNEYSNDLDRPSTSHSNNKTINSIDKIRNVSDLGDPSTSRSNNETIIGDIKDLNQPSTSCSDAETVKSVIDNFDQPSTSRSSNDDVVPRKRICISSVALNDSTDSDGIENEHNAYLNNINLSSWSDADFNMEDRSSDEHATKKKVSVPKRGYHLYKHLHELFPNISLEFIKGFCQKLRFKKYEVLPDELMNSLISYFLEKSKKKSVVGEAAVTPPQTDVTVTAATSTDGNAADVEENIPKLTIRLNPTETMNYQAIVLDDDDAYNNFEVVENAEDIDNGLVFPLMEMFPEACPTFIKRLVGTKRHADGVLDKLISEILDLDQYPKRRKISSPPRSLDAADQLELMKNILVDADPEYLQMMCEQMIDRPDDLKAFVARAVETRDYPTLKEYLRIQKISAQQKQYTTGFSIEKFLEVIPNPIEYFDDPNRKSSLINYTDQHYAICYLRNRFSIVSLRVIREQFKKNDHKLLPTCKALSQLPSNFRMKSKRSQCAMPEAIQNIPLMQEIAFYEHRTEIETFISDKQLNDEIEKEEAKAMGLMQTCACCYDDEIMLKDIYSCELGCVFCKDCVRRGAEVVFGDGKLDFPCLNNCTSHFTLQVLQAVLTPKMFSVVALKKQVEEVKAAGIEDLETCPFCDFATIPARDDKLFRCLNPECMKESCRNCKEPSHVPLRCEEVEKDGDVKARTYIENKMTEALLRTCYKCGMKFIKDEGCNKMTCSCGALMCYVCGKPVADYKHFNGPGGENMNLCPLYSDTNQLHREAVMKGAEAAKQEIGVGDENKLKIDPTSDIQDHYKTNKKQTIALQRAVNPFQAMDQAERLVQQRALGMLQHNIIRIGQRGILRHGHHHVRHHHHHDHHHDHEHL